MDNSPTSSADGRHIQNSYSIHLTCIQWRGPGKICLFSVGRRKLKVMHLVSHNIIYIYFYSAGYL